MKGCLYALGILAVLYVAVTLVFWYRGGPGNRYDVSRLQTEIALDLPVGTPRIQVKKWLTSNGFDVFPFGLKGAKTSPQSVGLGGRRYNTRSEIVCTYDVVLTFAFDGKNRLIRSSAEELSACL